VRADVVHASGMYDDQHLGEVRPARWPLSVGSDDVWHGMAFDAHCAQINRVGCSSCE